MDKTRAKYNSTVRCIQFFIILCFIFLNQGILSAMLLSTETLKVDGIHGNPSVIVETDGIRRNPIFSFEVADADKIDKFIIKIATTSGETTDIWQKEISSTTMNVTDYANYSLIRIIYEGVESLNPETTYYWSIFVYQKGVSTITTSLIAFSDFFTSTAEVVLLDEKADMRIDFNNPLKPGKITKIRLAAFDRDRDFKLRIFSISGTLVKEWAKITVFKDSYYTIEWNGQDHNGNFVERGIYIVNLYDETDKLRINRKLAVIR